jgi:transcriptional regulator with XRE-family HTH domain
LAKSKSLSKTYELAQQKIYLNLIGDKLRELRIKANLSQIQVAKALKYGNSQFVSNYERGMCPPTLKSVPTLAKLFKTPEKEIYKLLGMAQVECLIAEYKIHYNINPLPQVDARDLL